MIELLSSPEVWMAFLALVTMEIVLGIDNLLFISIASSKLPEHQQGTARRVGIGLALVLRLALLTMIAWIVGLTGPVFDLGITGSVGAHGEPSFDTAFSWRDLILIGGGVFLVWKATTEIQHKVQPKPEETVFAGGATAAFASVLLQIVQVLFLL